MKLYTQDIDIDNNPPVTFSDKIFLYSFVCVCVHVCAQCALVCVHINILHDFITFVGLCIHHHSQQLQPHKDPRYCPFIPTPTFFLASNPYPPLIQLHF